MKDWRKPDKRYVLVVEDKYTTTYYDATGDALYEVAYKLFLEREKARWYPEVASIRDPGPEPYTKEQLADLKRDWPKLHDEAWSERENWLRLDRRKNNMIEVIRKIAWIKETKNKKAAWDFLNSRNGFEYESVEIEELL